MAEKKVKMCGERHRYRVMAHDDRFAVMVKTFNAQKTYLYTITDLDRKVRGPVNLVFGLFEDVDSKDGAENLLRDLQEGNVAVSWRSELALTEAEINQLRAL